MTHNNQTSLNVGKTIKISNNIYDIISCMMTGSENYNYIIAKMLADYLKTHKKERDLTQLILDNRDYKINLKEFIEIFPETQK
jgi:hypothetical protein